MELEAEHYDHIYAFLAENQISVKGFLYTPPVQAEEPEAEEEPEVPSRAISGLTGWTDCFPKSRLAGTLFCGGVVEPNAISGHSKLDEAYEMGLHC